MTIYKTDLQNSHWKLSCWAVTWVKQCFRSISVSSFRRALLRRENTDAGNISKRLLQQSRKNREKRMKKNESSLRNAEYC